MFTKIERPVDRYFYTDNGDDPVPLPLRDRKNKGHGKHTKTLGYKYKNKLNNELKTFKLTVVPRKPNNELKIKAVAFKELRDDETDELLGSSTSAIVEATILVKAVRAIYTRTAPGADMCTCWWRWLA